jgi:hypothetical protein|tara:strand:+ start:515 stop:781 length:267 start_codon:yes stop_codon:yes gene_type:complete
MFITQTKDKGYNMVDKGITAAVVGVPTGMVVNSVGWASDTLVLGIIGLCITVVFGTVGVYYRIKADRRDEAADNRKRMLYERSITKEK